MSIPTEKTNYVFGPVPSRRLGHSLGVDLVPFKTCSYDCVYCQLGRTTCKTVEQKDFVPVKNVLKEIKNKVATPPLPDYITLSGSGEPTLYSEIYQLIREIKNITDIPVAVLTNGSLLWNEDVQRSVGKADLVIPSLDAGNEIEFQCVNRPHPDISFEKMIQGLTAFRRIYTGQLWLEVFLLNGVTANDESVQRIAEFTADIAPEKIQLNTVVRPPAEDFAFAVPEKQMHRFAALLGDKAEVIAEYRAVHDEKGFSVTRDAVYELLKRRPCSLEDIASGLSIHRNEAIKHVQELLTENKIKIDTGKKKRFFKILSSGRNNDNHIETQ